MGIRPAEKAGTWYAADPEALRGHLETYLTHPDPHLDERVVGGIVPHAGLAYSGATAGHVYAAMRRDSSPPETVLVFGAVHTMPLAAPAVWGAGAWQTPLGPLTVDGELSDALLKAGLVTENPAAHRGDNAIELQTPFLKYLFPAARFLPIAMPPLDEAEAIGASIAGICAQVGRRVVALGSTDLSHYGVAYGHAPYGVGRAAYERVREVERGFLTHLAEGRGAEAVAYAARHRCACGAGAAGAAAGFAGARGGCRGTILHHTTSHDVCPDGEPAMFVGYGAVIFTEPDRDAD